MAETMQSLDQLGTLKPAAPSSAIFASIRAPTTRTPRNSRKNWISPR